MLAVLAKLSLEALALCNGRDVLHGAGAGQNVYSHEPPSAESKDRGQGSGRGEDQFGHEGRTPPFTNIVARASANKKQSTRSGDGHAGKPDKDTRTRNSRPNVDGNEWHPDEG